jgi:integrase
VAKIGGLIQRAGSKVWSYDIRIRGTRFCGSTGETDRRYAERWLIEFKKQKAQEIAGLAGLAPMTFAVASSRWWDERGQYRKNDRATVRELAWLQTHIGMNVMLRAIDNNAVSRLVALRRADGASPATVNRSVVEPLRAIINRAKVWDQSVARIEWNEHLLKEPQERVREMTPAEEATLFATLRSDLHPIANFLVLTGLRRAEACALKWADVDLVGARMIVRGKGGFVDRLPLSNAAVELLRGELGNHHTLVFTFVNRNRSSNECGSRSPITPSFLGLEFWKVRNTIGLHDLRLHDLRHTAATRMIRSTGNLAVVQKMLRHKRINTTMRYAHVTEDDLRDALNKTTPTAAPIHAKITQEPEITP